MPEPIVIKIPQYFVHQNFDSFLQQVKVLEPVFKNTPQDVIFDFSENEYTSVLGVLLLAQAADHFSNLQCKSLVRSMDAERSNRRWFLQVMDFIKGDDSKELQNYFDTFRVPIQRCYQEKEVYEALNKRLIPLIRKEFNPPEPILKAINWVLWEAIGNSIVHGYSIANYEGMYPYPVYFCAFSYKQSIDIAILDVGQGIHKSLTSIEEYKNFSNADALKLAIQNGVSGSKEGSPGFGLYGSAEIAKQSNGELIIISGASKLVLQNSVLTLESSSYYQGTMLQLTIPAGINLDLAQIFGQGHLMTTEDTDTLMGNFDE